MSNAEIRMAIVGAGGRKPYTIASFFSIHD